MMPSPRAASPRRWFWTVVALALTACGEEPCTDASCFDYCASLDCSAYASPCAEAACNAARGCYSRPIPELDADGDGVCDGDDTCNGDGDEACAQDPCVPGSGRPDTDDDGVADACDRCPSYDDSYPLLFDWPLPGNHPQDWVINNYLDHDPSAGGMRDHVGNTGEDAKTYDGHRGIDIDIASFRSMDASYPVLAAAEGVVERVVDGFADRSTDWFDGCGAVVNQVEIRHPSGHLSRYLHLRKDSIVVSEGQSVGAGTPLGEVGSSGCSTGPHLHFEVHRCDGDLVDPFLDELWRDPPPYDVPVGLMDVVVRDAHIMDFSEVHEPLPNVTQLAPESPIGMAVILGGGLEGERVTLRLDDPAGEPRAEGEVVFTKSHTRSLWWWNRTLGQETGTWTVRWLLNDEPARDVTIDVE